MGSRGHAAQAALCICAVGVAWISSEAAGVPPGRGHMMTRAPLKRAVSGFNRCHRLAASVSRRGGPGRASSANSGTDYLSHRTLVTSYGRISLVDGFAIMSSPYKR